MNPDHKPTAILIAGMHRSGTSALSRTLNLAGCEITNYLMDADSRSNERGHWESQRIFELNSAILESAGSRWDDWETPSPGWYQSPLYNDFFQNAQTTIKDEFPSSLLFVLKDPRFCLLMGFWLKVIESIGATPMVIMPVRNPLNVAASLRRRDDIDPSIGKLLWLRHVLDAEANSRHHRRVTVGFDQLLGDWRSVLLRIGEQLGLTWPRLSSIADLEIDEFLSPDLRHHADSRADVEPTTQSIRWVSEVYDILGRWSIDKEKPSDQETLDTIRSQLNDLGPIFGRPILLGRAALQSERVLQGKVNHLTVELDTAKIHARSLADTVSSNEWTLQTLRNTVEEHLQTIGKQSEEAASRNAEIDTLHQTVNDKTNEIDKRNIEIASLNQTIALQADHAERRDNEIETLITARNETNEQRRQQVNSLLQAVSERDSRIAAVLQSSSWRLTKPLRSSKLATKWLFYKLVRLTQISGWILTGRLRKAAHAMLPFYRRHAPEWLGSLIPRRLRHWLRATSTTPPKYRVEPESETIKPTDEVQFVPEYRGASPSKRPVRLISFYLPQFHPIPENDQWWGEGFTEWTNVRAAEPQFAGHYQPRVPIDQGYYDLRNAEVLRRQIELATRYGIGGFCFYFYWFGGHRLLETPLLNYLNDPSLDFPFCLCWANENWTRRWDGREQDLLIGQEHSPDDDLQFIEHISRYLVDPRYIRIEGKPLLLIYRPALLPDAAATVERWRVWCRGNGVDEPYVAMVQSFQSLDPRPFGMDAAIEFPWHTGLPTDITAHVVPSKSEFRGYVFDWEDYADKCEEQPDQPWLQIRGVMPGWDNTARRKTEAHLFQGHTPAGYKRWLLSAMRWTLAKDRSPDERLLFINAWNEWGEGAYLEPDQRFGYAFLQATRDALEAVAEQPISQVQTHPLHNFNALRGEVALISKQIAPVAPGFLVSPAGIRLLWPELPDISIIIPVYGQCQITLQCLKSLSDLTDARSFEVVVVDDASTDETGSILPKLPGIRYVRNEENLGFLQSCNRGVGEARGQYVLLLNNDTRVQNGAIDALADTFETHADAGLVGAKLYFEDGTLQEAGGIIWSDGSAMNYGRGDDPRKPEFNYVRDADYCSGAAIMLPLALWRKLGGFDNYYVRAYYEDTDLAMRVRDAGYRVLYQPFAKIVHCEGATSGTDESQGEKRFQAENRIRFLDRWRTTLEAIHCASTLPPDIAKDRTATGHALVIDWAIPMADHDSGSLDIINLVRMLGRLQLKVTFAGHRDLDYWGTYTDALQMLGVEVLYAPYAESLGNYLKKVGKNIDYILVHRVGVFKDLISDLRKLCPAARIIFHTVDLHHIREARQAETEKSDKLKRRSQLTKRTEIGLARKAHAVVVVSNQEMAQMQDAVPNTPVFHIPLIREMPGAGESDFHQRNGIAFLGNYLHPPNLDAILHFVSEIWPAVHAAIPQAGLIVAGAQMPPEVERLGAADGVSTIGYVDNLTDFFSQIRLTVAPLRYGAGTKGKVVSSLCHGVPVISSPIGAEGMGLEDGRNILIAHNPEEWVRQAGSAYCDEVVWQKLSAAGLAAMRENHSLDAGLTVLKEVLGLDDGMPAAARNV